jgi:phosphoribosylglycinamide formyltransferase-1
VPVLPADTADTLAARVLTVEHRSYPLALRLVAEGKVRMEGGKAITAGDLPVVDGASLISAAAG